MDFLISEGMTKPTTVKRSWPDMGTVKLGQTWVRKDGRKVKITGKRLDKGLTKFELTPLGKGRKSWKYESLIQFELKIEE